MEEAGASPARWPWGLQRNPAFWRSPISLCRERTESYQPCGFQLRLHKVNPPSLKRNGTGHSHRKVQPETQRLWHKRKLRSRAESRARLTPQPCPVKELACTRHLSAGQTLERSSSSSIAWLRTAGPERANVCLRSGLLSLIFAAATFESWNADCAVSHLIPTLSITLTKGDNEAERG